MSKFAVLFLNFLILACATRYTASEQYLAIVKSEKLPLSKRQTVIFFLVDGLPLKTLNSAVFHGQVPAIKNHFLKKDPVIHQAYSAFPSLTFTNIAGLLTEKPVHLSTAYGNSLSQQGQVIRFEDLLDRSKFAKRIQGKTVFRRLNHLGERTISLDYGLGADATLSSDFADLKVGLAAGLKDYLYLDQKRIDSLDNLLKGNKPSDWPGFIFVHLIGIDFLSHQLGPESVEVKKYLTLLDQRLAPVLRRIEKADVSSHQTVSILSADHGFAFGIKRRAPIEKIVADIDLRALTLNEGRMAAVFTKLEPAPVAEKLLLHASIETVAWLEGNQLVVKSQKQKSVIRLTDSARCSPFSKAVSTPNSNAAENVNAICPELLDSKSQNLFYPHFILNLIYYFQTPNHPDIVIVPAKETSFSSHDFGVHGGPTADEIDVPVLLRNATFPLGIQKPAIWQLLQFL